MKIDEQLSASSQKLFRLKINYKIFVSCLFILLSIAAHAQQDEEQEQQQARLDAYRDLLSQTTDFSLSFLRYRPRGYADFLNPLIFEGIPIENWQDGYAEWSIISGLKDFNSMRDSRRLSGGITNRNYRYRAALEFDHHPHKGFGFAIQALRRWGESPHIQGVATNSYALGAQLSVQGDYGNLSLSLFYAPSARTTQRASTAEAYEILGNNLYNSGWGRQGNRVRSSRHRLTNVPFAVLNYKFARSRFTLNANVSAQYGTTSYSTLNWQNAPNPYPDYYRYMPSFEDDESMRDLVREAWQRDERVSQIFYQNLYDINGYQGRASYITERRVRDLQNFRAAVDFSIGWFRAGANATYARNRNYKTVEDLMGGDHWLDIDAFVEQDDHFKEQSQSNIRNPNFHAQVGDTFGYDYAMTMIRSGGSLGFATQEANYWVGGKFDVQRIIYQREGFFEKENFAGSQSFGLSPSVINYDYRGELTAGYRLGGRFSAQANLQYLSLSSAPSALFLSPSFRNATVPQSTNREIITGEITGEYRIEQTKVRGTLYYTSIRNNSQIINLYDDNIYQYTHYWLREIGERYFGLEIASEFPIAQSINLGLVALLGDNRYTTNPRATQWHETTGELLRTDECAYYENLHISGSPQTIGVASLSYSPRGFIAQISANFFDNSYISITPLRRTARSQMGIAGTTQEKLSTAMTLDCFLGKTIYLAKGQSIGIYLSIANLLNRKDIRVSGYESYRTVNTAAGDSRYYYALGINGNLTITYRL